jgi:hypothetical protein
MSWSGGWQSLEEPLLHSLKQWRHQDRRWLRLQCPNRHIQEHLLRWRPGCQSWRRAALHMPLFTTAKAVHIGKGNRFLRSHGWTYYGRVSFTFAVRANLGFLRASSAVMAWLSTEEAALMLAVVRLVVLRTAYPALPVRLVFTKISLVACQPFFGLRDQCACVLRYVAS